ncbi:septation protein SepH [Dermatophilaceae bacterium Soc4.6]
MQDLRLVGVHDDGTHLLLEGADGTRLRLPLDDTLRAAVRQDRSRLGQLQIELDGGLRPRDVQALVRAGGTADDVAARAGWTVEKVRRYEGPILAERAHVADLARLVRMRTRSSGPDAPTLIARVGERMRARDVDPTTSTWDSWRDAEAAHWTVVMRFVAGGRERRALWSFELSTQTVTPLDDEARWLTEEEAPAVAGPIPAPATRVQTAVYDVEAEGGVAAVTRRAPDVPVDLVTAMRERSQARGRRTKRGRAPTDVPTPEPPTDALPITGLSYDPEVHGLPPAAHPRAGEETPPQVSQTDAAPEQPTTEAVAEPADDRSTGGSDAAGEEPSPEESPAALAAVEEEWPAVGDEAGDDSEVGDEVVDDSEVGDEVGGEQDEPAARPEEPKEKPRPKAAGQPGPAAPAAAETARPAARRGRPQVPSWDDIMFGSRRD